MDAAVFLPLTTFIVFVFQIVQARIFSYVFAYHLTGVAISLVLFGLGAGAYLQALWSERRDPRAVISASLLGFALSVPMILLSLLLVPSRAPIVVLALLPFLWLGATVSRFYEIFRSNSAHRAYLLDLAGGGFACLVAAPLLETFGGTRVLAFVCVLACAMSAASAPSRFWRSLAVVIGGVFVAMLILSPRFPDPLVSGRYPNDKPLGVALRAGEGSVTDSAWSLLGRADVFERPGMRHVRWIYNDGTNSTLLVAPPQSDDQRAFLDRILAAVPYKFTHPSSALIIGSGGGLEVNMARAAGVSTIDAVEINPATIRLVDRFREFPADIYHAPGVRLYVDEGRGFLARSPNRYDVIEMSLVLTATAQSGSYALAEHYLYTKEGFRSLLGHLTNDGVLALIDDSPERSLKQAVMLTRVMEESGDSPAEATKRLCVVESSDRAITGYRYLVLAFARPVDATRAALVAGAVKARGDRAVWVPGLVDSPEIRELAMRGADAFAAEQELNFSPATDERPFFFDFARGAKRVHILLPFALTVLGAGVAALFFSRRARRSGSANLTALWAAFVLGSAFMVFELAALQRLSLLSGGPMKSLPVILFALLLWCGLGSQLAARWSRQSEGRSLLPVFCFAPAAGTALTAIILKFFYLPPPSLPMAAGAALAVVLLAPAGLCLGLPFPSLLSRQQGDRGAISHLWAMNGLGSVAGGAVFILTARLLGQTGAMITSSVLYLVVARVLS